MEYATVSEIDSFEVVNNDGISKDMIRTFALSLRGTTIHLCSLGASILKFNIPVNHKEEVVDIVAGYTNAQTMYETGNPVYFHSIVGRVANRIENGTFTLDGKTHKIDINNPPNSLHGGKYGYCHKIWDAKITSGGIKFTYLSPDGDEQFPGTVKVTATYVLRPSFSSDGVVLQLQLDAQLLDDDKSTPINLANHSYFNLGDSKEGILDHTLVVESDLYTPVNEHSIPTRQVVSLNDDDAMDLRKPHQTLRDALHQFGMKKVGLTPQQSKQNLNDRTSIQTSPYGFDHNYIVRKQSLGLAIPKVASLTYGKRNLTIYSTAPGVQCYTANYLGSAENSTVCKSSYQPWDAICLEAQHFPDSISTDSNKNNSLFWDGKCPILTGSKPNYHQTILYRVEVDYPTALSCYKGSDTEGNNFTSIDEMWDAQDLSSWYGRAKDWYEENCGTTVDGVLGGIGYISDIDLQGSRQFLEKLQLPTNESSLACECGAGIGRVTKGLLLDFVDRCDLVESSSRLLGAAPEYVGNLSGKCRFYSSELQNWEPGTNKYSIIWIQWVLCYLTDNDIVEFLRRCSESLVDGGWIILKENTCSDEAFIVDVDDASITRSLDYWLDLIAIAGLVVRDIAWQDDFPDEIYAVPLIALQR